MPLNNIIFKKFNRILLISIIFSQLTTFTKIAVSQEKSSNQKNLPLLLEKKEDIQVSQLEKPSLGSIGVKTDVNKIMGLDVWQGLNAESIVENLNYIPDIVTSKHLQFYLNNMYISSSNPPDGNSDQIIKFVETRLMKIKSSGQSKKLYQLVKQLPEGTRWEFWKKWLVEYELFNHKDKAACKYINEKSKSNLDNFWQTTFIFCLSIEGKLNQSEFIYDLIKSRGFADDVFENLFQIIKMERKDFNLNNKKNKIKPFHIVMMDTLKIPIEANYIAHLGIEYTDSLLSLTYLTPKARSFLLDKKNSYSFVPVEQTFENYKSVANGKIDVNNAFSSYNKNPNGYNKSNLWFSLISIKDDIKKVEAILRLIKLETKYGRFQDVTNLYLPILDKIDKTSLTKELNRSIKKLKIASKPNLFPNNKLANMLMLKKDSPWDLNIILEEKAWPIIPILEQAGMKEPESINWLLYINRFDQVNIKKPEYNKWNSNYNVKRYILKKSIEQTSTNGNKSLTILLIARLIGNNPFIDFDLADIITIKNSLNKIGLVDLANKITLEIMTTKLISF